MLAKSLKKLGLVGCAELAAPSSHDAAIHMHEVRFGVAANAAAATSLRCAGHLAYRTATDPKISCLALHM